MILLKPEVGASAKREGVHFQLLWDTLIPYLGCARTCGSLVFFYEPKKTVS